MDTINSLIVGFVTVAMLIALAARELVTSKNALFHTTLIKFLNVTIGVTGALFIYLFARTVIDILRT